MTQQQYYYGTGRRKNAVARVRVYASQGPVTVNGKPVEEVFPVDSWRQLALLPLMVTNTRTDVTVIAKTHGGRIIRPGRRIRSRPRSSSCRHGRIAQAAAAGRRAAYPRFPDEGKQEVRAQAGPGKRLSTPSARLQATSPLRAVSGLHVDRQATVPDRQDRGRSRLASLARFWLHAGRNRWQEASLSL